MIAGQADSSHKSFYRPSILSEEPVVAGRLSRKPGGHQGVCSYPSTPSRPVYFSTTGPTSTNHHRTAPGISLPLSSVSTSPLPGQGPLGPRIPRTSSSLPSALSQASSTPTQASAAGAAAAAAVVVAVAAAGTSRP